MPFCFMLQMHDRYIEIKTFFNSHLNFHKAELLQVVSSPFICNVVYLHDKFLSIKKIEIEETKITYCSIFKTDMIRVSLVFDFLLLGKF